MTPPRLSSIPPVLSSRQLFPAPSGSHTLAAPSWVMPGTLAENCAFLAGKVDEAGLLFFETAACLAYDATDLPTWLADLPLRYHVHLPADLPMRTPEHAARQCHLLLQKIDFLSPTGAVLHPPASGPDEAAHLRRFLQAWHTLGRSPSLLLLENTRHNNLLTLTDIIEEFDLQVCLDMGHVLQYAQHELLDAAPLMRRVKMLHVNAPGKKGEHLPLSCLAPKNIPVAQRMFQALPPSAVVMMELFDWSMIEDSLSVLHGWFESHKE